MRTDFTSIIYEEVVRMASRDVTRSDVGASAGTGFGGTRTGSVARRLTTETKQFFKTSEFWAYLLVVVGILIAGNSIEADGAGSDYFNADNVWLYITILTVGYMLSRGFAKSGVRDPYDEDRSHNGHTGHTG
jgi:hypothetical protein